MPSIIKKILCCLPLIFLSLGLVQAQDWKATWAQSQQEHLTEHYAQALANYRLAWYSLTPAQTTTPEAQQLGLQYVQLANELWLFPQADTLSLHLISLSNTSTFNIAEAYPQLALQRFICLVGLDRFAEAELLLTSLEKSLTLARSSTFLLAKAHFLIRKEALDKARNILANLNKQTLDTLGWAHLMVLRSEINYRTGHFREGKKDAASAQQLLAAAHQDQSPVAALALEYLGLNELLLGDYDSAYAAYADAEAIWASLGLTTNLAYARVMEGLFIVEFEDNGDPHLALDYLEQAIQINQQFKPKSVALVDNLANLAQWKYRHEDFEAARPIAKRAVDLAAKTGLKLEYAQALNALGSLYINSAYLQNMKPGDKTTNLIHAYEDTAKLYFRLANKVYRQLPYQNLWLKANILSNWASTDTSRTPLLAAKLYKRATKVYLRYVGDSSVYYLNSLYNLAITYDLSNKRIQATRKAYSDVLRLSKRVLGANHPDYTFYLFRVAPFFAEIGDLAQAKALFSEAKDKQLFLIHNYYIAFSDSSRLRYASTIQAELSYYCSFLQKHHELFPQGLEELQALIATLKNLSTDFSLVNLLKRQAIQDEEIRAKLQLFEVTQDSLSFDLEQTLNIDNVVKRRDQLEQELRSSFVSPYSNAAFSRSDLLQKLAPDEAVVDFFRIYNYDAANARVIDTTYYAMVDRPTWPAPRCIELLNEKQLQSLMGANEQNIPKLLFYPQWRYKLYTLIWKPLESHLSGVKTIHYAPDGLLQRLNLYTLVINAQGDSSLFQKYKLQRYTDFRNFDPHPDSIKVESFSLFGNPNFDKADFNPLGAVDKELDFITQITSEAKVQTNPFLGEKANKQNVLSIDKSKVPFVAHIACHGFALSPLDELSEEKQLLLSPKLKQLAAKSNPLYRSGLVLAAAPASARDSAYDSGVLLAHELAGLDLSNCQLMTLSACESGLGWAENLEGVIGFQHALKVAGVKKQLVSLWKVLDGPTSRFMEVFYGLYFKHVSASEALRETIRRIAKEYGPDVWGAFVLLD
jgi:CHAT domain-containing protein